MKRIGILLSLCLLLTALTACGTGTPAPTTIQATTTATTTTIPTEATTEAATETTTEVPTDAENLYAWWGGDWYGWWCMYDATGRFESFDNQAWDVCAVIEVADTEPVGHLRIWDSVLYEFGVLVNCDVAFEEGVGEHGRMVSQDGSFFHSGADWELDGVCGAWAPIMPYQLQVDPDYSSVSQFYGMIEIEGTYIDPENEDDAFGYRIYLRPWGYWWEDVLEGDTSECFYMDMMPIRYDDWYWPLLEQGEDMPSSFAIGDQLLEN